MKSFASLQCSSIDDVPRPDEIAAKLDNNRRESLLHAEVFGLDPRNLPRPVLGDGILAEVERIMATAGREAELDFMPQRNSVVFVSGD